MNKKLSLGRAGQKIAGQIANKVAAKASSAIDGVTSGLQHIDQQFALSEKLKQAGTQIGDLAQQADHHYAIGAKADAVKRASSTAGEMISHTAARLAEDSGIYKAVDTVSDTYKNRIAYPTAALIAKHELDKAAQSAFTSVGNGYGAARRFIKPYFAAETTEALLVNAKTELTYISACVMQISAGEASTVAGQFGRAIASKITGVATTGALLALVGTFGTAGTGTAIGTLSGAAATNATLAWVGGLLGGGMAAGAVLSGGLSVIVGLGAYKLLRTDRRPFENLTEVEQRIVQSCWFLIAMINDLLDDSNRTFDAATAQALATNTFMPLHSTLVEHADAICSGLDIRNAIAFRQHVLIDFQRVVIEGFLNFEERDSAAKSAHIEFVIGGVFYALLTRTAVDGSVESQLVLDSLRRSSTVLAGASEAELSDYLDSYDESQLKGIANNIKGIYHEELWVYNYNETHSDSYAEMYGATNHAGADIQIKDFDTDEVVSNIQLKATNSVAYVNQHLDRYPDIEVHVTNETAVRMTGVHASGIHNSEITEKVNDDLAAMADNTMSDRLVHSAELSAAIAGGHDLIAMLRGNKDFPQAVTDTVKKVGSAGAATAITAYLFS